MKGNKWDDDDNAAISYIYCNVDENTSREMRKEIK